MMMMMTMMMVMVIVMVILAITLAIAMRHGSRRNKVTTKHSNITPRSKITPNEENDHACRGVTDLSGNCFLMGGNTLVSQGRN